MNDVRWAMKQLLHYIASHLHLMMKYPLLYVFFPNNCIALKVFFLRFIIFLFIIFSLFVPKVTLVSHERKYFLFIHSTYHIFQIYFYIHLIFTKMACNSRQHFFFFFCSYYYYFFFFLLQSMHYEFHFCVLKQKKWLLNHILWETPQFSFLQVERMVFIILIRELCLFFVISYDGYS